MQEDNILELELPNQKGTVLVEFSSYYAALSWMRDTAEFHFQVEPHTLRVALDKFAPTVRQYLAPYGARTLFWFASRRREVRISHSEEDDRSEMSTHSSELVGEEGLLSDGRELQSCAGYTHCITLDPPPSVPFEAYQVVVFRRIHEFSHVLLMRENIAKFQIVTFFRDSSQLLSKSEDLVAQSLGPSLTHGPAGRHLLRHVDEFRASIRHEKQAVETMVTLCCPPKRIEGHVTQKTVQKAAQKSEIVLAYEQTVLRWIADVDRLLATGNAITSCDEGESPFHEIQQWKEHIVHLGSVLEQLRLPEHQTVLQVLKHAGGRVVAVLRKWEQLVSSIHQAIREAHDSARYLQKISELTALLYEPNATVSSVEPRIATIIQTISRVLCASQTHRSADRVTALLMKVTHRVVVAAKHTLASPVSVLDDPSVSNARQRIADCLRLAALYRDAFREHSATFSSEGLLRRDCDGTSAESSTISESATFGKLDLLCHRLAKLDELLFFTVQFQRVNTLSIEGSTELTVRFQSIVQVLRHRSGDPLDARSNAFDLAFNEFKVQVGELSKEVVVVINNAFLTSRTTNDALLLLLRMKKILSDNAALVQLLDEKFVSLFPVFTREIEAIATQYESQKAAPPIERNMPPVAGAIAWSRQLLRQIEAPMKSFLAQGRTLLKGQEAKRMIKAYNALAGALVGFETLWLETWLRAVEKTRSGLSATLFVCDSETRKLWVNFDSKIAELVRETSWLRSFGCEVPRSAVLLLHRNEQITACRELAHSVAKRYETLMGIIPLSVAPILVPRLQQLNAVINPGLTTVSWQALQAIQFLEEASTAISEAASVVERINATANQRVACCLEKVVVQEWVCFLRNSSPFHNISALLSTQSRHSIEVARTINSLNMEIVGCIQDVVEFATEGYSKSTRASLELAQRNLYLEYEQKVLDAVVQAMRDSVVAMRSRLNESTTQANQQLMWEPLLRVEVVYNPGTGSITISPNLDEVQHAMNKVARMMLESTHRIYRWEQDEASPLTHNVVHVLQALMAESSSEPWQKTALTAETVEDGEYRPVLEEQHIRDIYLRVGKSRIITIAFLQLTGVVAPLQRQINVFLDQFHPFQELLSGSRIETVQHFVKSEPRPTVEDFEAKLRMLTDLEKELETTHSAHQIGCLSLDLRPTKQALKSELLLWRLSFGGELTISARNNLDRLAQRIEDFRIRLSRPIQELIDVTLVANAISELRAQDADLDAALVPIQNAYDVLHRYGIRIPREDSELADSLTASRRSLGSLCVAAQEILTRTSGRFKALLLGDLAGFADNARAFREEYERVGPNEKGIQPRLAIERLKYFTKKQFENDRRLEHLRKGEELFGLKKREYPGLDGMRRDLALLSQLFDLYAEALSNIQSIDDLSFYEADFQLIDQTLARYKEACLRLPKSLREFSAYHELRELVDNVSATIPYLHRLRDKCFKARHWDILSKLCQTSLNPIIEEVKLKSFFDAHLPAVVQELEELLSSALKEADIETKLARLAEDMTNRNVTLGSFKNRGNLLLKSDATAELLQELEDAQLLLASLLNSRYNEVFKKEILSWSVQVSTSQQRLEEWLEVQHGWVYMEAVFISTADIAKEMPQEVKRFITIDRQWSKIMKRAEEQPNLLKLCAPSELLANTLPHLKTYLEVCQKSLVGYMNTKRIAFSRFFFLSDSQLLDLLAHGTDPTAIQPHLLNLTSNVASLTFDSFNQIAEWTSAEGESVRLISPLPTETDVVSWLNRFLLAMRKSLKIICIRMRDELFKLFADQFWITELSQLIHGYPAQVALLGIQLLWTFDCESMLHTLRTEKNVVASKLRRAKCMLDAMVEASKEPALQNRDRLKLETMITIQIHQLDVVVGLSKNAKRLKGVGDFDWTKQLRCGWRSDREEVVISVADVDFSYGYEYIGCVERLVVTDLTDRIYISCAQAMSMHFGGAPTGPAGTGKTETTRDLGRACGRYFIVVNCSEMMNTEGMGKLIRGIAQSGCWCGFDEINRIEIGTLSVVAAQIATVFHAQRDRKTQFTFFDGSKVTLDRDCGIFVTMNPGYAGRTELPENMKSLFRSIAVVVPDRQTIIRARLAASGFQDATNLSKKLNLLYHLASEQLSQQNHYDFGLRNILSVLRTCGPALREAASSACDGSPLGSSKNVDETAVLLKVLESMNLSKLIDQDNLLFRQLLVDLFPMATGNNANNNDLIEAILAKARSSGFVPVGEWIERAVMLYDQWNVRHGLCLLGEPGTGKTSLTSILIQAINVIRGPCRTLRMNPKAVPSSELFGSFDTKTGDWADGVFVSLWRRALRRKNDHHWLVMDGPMDSVWIENLNSVLDDTKILTLASGDRMPLPPSLTLLFEVDTMAHASPATVSRLGLVYVGPKCVGWEPLVSAWSTALSTSSARVPKDMAEILTALLSSYLKVALKFVEQHLAWPCTNVPVVCASNCIKFAGALIASLAGEHQLGTQEVERIAAFALVWGVQPFLRASEEAFSGFLQKMQLSFPVGNTNEMSSDSEETNQVTPFEFFLNHSGQWERWSSLVPSAKAIQEELALVADITSSFIITSDCARLHYLMKLFSASKTHFLAVGDAGTAKSSATQQFLRKEKLLYREIAFSYATAPTSLGRSLTSLLDKTAGNTWTPPLGQHMFLFIDDLHLPQVTEWGDQPANELLRELLEDKGFFSIRNRVVEWNSLTNVSFCGCMRIPDASSHDIPERLKRQFAIVRLQQPSAETVQQIYSTLFSRHLSVQNGFSAEISDCAERVGEVAYTVWKQCDDVLRPTPLAFHYQWNLKDLSRLLHGIALLRPTVVASRSMLAAALIEELERSMGDKLSALQDQQFFSRLVRSTVSSSLGEPSRLQGSLWTSVRKFDELDDDETGAHSKGGIYQPQTIEGLVNFMSVAMERYNEANRKAPMNLAWSKFFLTHLFRVCRVLSTRQGNVLLVGVGGSGKQSIAKVAASICNMKVVSLSVSTQHTFANVVDEVKEAFKTAMFGTNVLFLVSDNDEIPNGLLEYASALLTSGELPAVYQRDELEILHEELRSSLGLKPEETMGPIFTQRVRDHAHVMCCFSPAGNVFREHVRRFPSLLQCCTCNWFPPWPQEALRETAAEVFALQQEKASALTRCPASAAAVHDTARLLCEKYATQCRKHVNTTPKGFFDFLDCSISVYQTHLERMEQQRTSVENGLLRMEQTQQGVTAMRAELGVKQLTIEASAKELEGMLEEITSRTEMAEETTAKVEKVRNRLFQQHLEIQQEKDSADRDMEAALPALRDAEDALRTIRADDINTVKKFHTPPMMVRRIMDAVLILRNFSIDAPAAMDTEPTTGMRIIRPSWASAKVMMSDMQFLNSLMSFDKDSVTAEQAELLQPYLDQEDFTVERARTACGSLAGLCTWVRSMVRYYEISKAIEPKKARVRKAELSLFRAQRALKAAEEDLAEQNKVLAEVKENYQAAMGKKAALQEDAENTRRRLQTAEQLIVGLDSERKRWAELRQETAVKIKNLSGDSLVSGAFLCYGGPFDLQFRTELLRQCISHLRGHGVPFTEGLDPRGFLVSDDLLAQWRADGLPQDELSIQNAVLSELSSRSTLLVDPQNQGRAWVLKTHPADRLVFTAIGSINLTASIEDALVNGRTLLIEDVESNLGALNGLRQLITKSFQRVMDISGQLWVNVMYVGQKEVVVSPNFKVILSTSSPSPIFPPELFSQVTVIECSVTPNGLEDQLLAMVINHEEASLEADRVAVALEVFECQTTLHECEQLLLNRLASSIGSILDDTDLVNVLSDIKDRVGVVQEKLRAARETESRILAAREEFRSAALRGSALFFAVLQMATATPMYSSSLAAFVELFEDSLRFSEPNSFPPKRINNIIQHVTAATLRHYTLGFYNHDKPLFVFAVALAIDRSQKYSASERATFEGLLDFFVRGETHKVSEDHCRALARWDWFPAESISCLAGLHEFPSTRVLLHSLESEAGWKSFMEDEAPEFGPLPGGIDESLAPFQRLLLVRLLRTDRLLPATKYYAAAVVGENLLTPPPVDFTAIAKNVSCPTTAVLCLLSEGVDPTSLIDSVAKRWKANLAVVSMGTGQETHARKAIQRALAEGGWVLLQNMHLSLSYCAELAEALRSAKQKNAVDGGFRLWYTAAPHVSFPIPLLQISYRVSDEPPQGMKAGMQRAYQTISQDQLDSLPTRDWRHLLFVCCWLHTTLTQRRKFGPLGWCGRYEFTTHDLSATTQFLYNHLYEAKKGPTWKCIQYMIGQVHLGGRITDERDQRIMVAYTDRWLHEGCFSKTFELVPGVSPPDVATTGAFRDFINNLPSTEYPEEMLLHNNAEIAHNLREASRVIQHLSGVSDTMRLAVGRKEKEAQLTQALKSVQGTMGFKLTQNDVQNLQRKTSASPVIVALLQEIHRAIAVKKLVEETCNHVADAIRGQVNITVKLQRTMDCLGDWKVPSSWEGMTFHSPSLSAWLENIRARFDQLERWVKRPKLKVIWLSGLFFPQGFLTSVRQELTHAHQGWTLDTVSLRTEVTKFVNPEQMNISDESPYFLVYGLSLEGAQWDRSSGSLADPSPRQLFSVLPPIRISVTQTAGEAAAGVSGTSRSFYCPVYKDPSRAPGTYIFDITLRIPSGGPQNVGFIGETAGTGLSTTATASPSHSSGWNAAEKWTLCGTAAHCMTW